MWQSTVAVMKRVQYLQSVLAPSSLCFALRANALGSVRADVRHEFSLVSLTNLVDSFD